ncbi:putative nitrate ABC transporter, permease protein [Mycobacterium parmense]|uniref:Putative nitrate ABC transporter, permease protein n=2 Tax=Mycobacterium parmense TaxID=185642 RepID=A0A7I7YXN0_9MYCO|nr:ABC transporter permease [Mycobacterium parmense]MCV7349903.1 ABC transporter permease [Mycobacterium parmense]BBZ46566.1 putative nitrate ABC transporter, permease protein [Mycobacterium parmense]
MADTTAALMLDAAKVRESDATLRPPGRRHPRVRARIAAVALPLLPVAAFLLLWQQLTAHQVVAWLRFNRMPTPGSVYDALVARVSSGGYYDDLLASLQRILLGFGLAAVAGVALGMLVGRSRTARMTLRPFIEVFRPIPAIALVPLTILLFPSSEQGIVFITFFAAFFPVVVSTIHAMDALPQVWEDAARTMGARRLSILLHVVLPGALPGIFSGLSVAMGVAWICVVSAEMISGQYGIGYYTWQCYGLLDYAGVVVGMVSIGALGLLTAWLVERVGRRVNNWLPRSAR